MDFAMWAEILNINTLAPVRVMHALLPHLKQSKQAKVMNVTSDLGALSNDNPIYLGYSASKAALNKYMRLAALELKEEGIAVGLIHPGWVQTDMGGSAAPISPLTSATGIVKVIDRLDLTNAGSFWQWDGALHEW
jgi:NAD(P)-dependent dehydrogenase (short-subunit alcohol dehydrogenase family)